MQDQSCSSTLLSVGDNKESSGWFQFQQQQRKMLLTETRMRRLSAVSTAIEFGSRLCLPVVYL